MANATTAAPAASLIAAAGPATLYSASIFNNGTDQWVQIHDSATLPANGATPVLVARILANMNQSFNFAKGRTFKNGICICNSSSPTTLTIGTPNFLFDAQVG